ncbi:pyridoxamine kinase [Fusobacterium perfoetens]|uniref:pyridoxamine kinase n=1 Tax=Fusobacterium perfoetens TaxID=852 RepID=UPI001F2C4210|nr:pyridoxamine kinase [Fusobacterium perfoetens]MCF2626186.1 pyridoxamine kinase [Fusobacterium perfoetens]
MSKLIKKVAAIHDLSGFGRASLTTVIPILSTMGIQVCPVPTAILSTHTSNFTGYSFIDLTDYMEEHIAHWKKLNLEFDCIYSGFLGSPRQIKIVSDFVDHFGHKDNLVVVDPVLGDNGSLYGTMGQEMVTEMRKLVSKADIITPNFTEAAFLLGEEYKEVTTEQEVKEWLVRIAEMGPKIVIITSVPDEKVNEFEKNMSVIAYNKEDDVFWKVSCKYIPVSYPGTGDAYTSVLIGSLLQGDSLPVAIDRAMQFVTQCIKASYGFKYPSREGVLLERNLNILNVPVLLGAYELLKNGE